MIEHSVELDKLATALAKAQAAVKGAKKDSANPFFKSSYADLASVWEACREALTENGLSVAQFPGFSNGTATLDTMLLHSSGQWLQASAGAPLVKQDAQSVGSVLTYLRRYALAAVASVSPVDDDGNAASAPKSERGGTSTATRSKDAAGAVPRSAPTAPLRPPETGPLSEKPRSLEDAKPDSEAPTWPFGTERGRMLKSYDSPALMAKRDWLVKKQKNPQEFADLILSIDDELGSRGGL